MSRLAGLGRNLASAAQRLDWQKLAAELVIVVVGVFLGMQVTNWNEERRERVATLRLLEQFQPELRDLERDGQRMRDYYAVNESFVDRAFAGWRGDPAIDDEEFVTSAYQASRIEGQATNTQVWAQIYGADQIRKVSDPQLRQALIDVLTIDSSVSDWRQLMTDYRIELRKIVPEDIQAAIQRDCSETRDEENASVGAYSAISSECDTALPEEAFSEAASILRAHPELVGELRQHKNVVAVYLYNNNLAQEAFTKLSREIERVRED